MKAPSRVRASAVSLLLAGSLAACGTGDGSDSSGESGASGQSSPTSSDPSTGEMLAVSLMTADSDLGTILVDSAGVTLYLFTNDSPGVSTCEGDCLTAWPPFLGQPRAGTGVDDALIGSLVRSDGTTQVTYDGWPLYYWSEDAGPGDTSGQGVNDVWWVVSPEGAAIGATP